MNDRKCNGMIFKGHNKIYKTRNGISNKIEIIPLKRKSCGNCNICQMDNAVFNEYRLNDMLEFFDLSNVEDNKLYRMNLETSTDWESGINDIDRIYFEEIE